MQRDFQDLLETVLSPDFWRLQFQAGVLVFIPHENNNHVKKLLTLGLFSVWAVLTVGEASGFLELKTLSYGVMSALVFAIIAKQHDIELDRIQ